MKEQIISFEVAKLAKEKGFNIESDKYYCIVPIEEQKVGDVVLEEETYTHIAMGKGEAVWFRYAPITSQSLLQKWLREKYKMDIYIEALLEKQTKNRRYSSVLIYFQGDLRVIIRKNFSKEDDFYLVYEEALEDILEKALKLIDKNEAKESI